MNAETADNAGTPQLRQFHMVNTNMFYHPKKYKELHGLTSRKCNTRQRSQGGLPVNGASNSDQAISDEASTEATSVRPGPGLQVTSHKLPGPRPISNANKGLIHRHQASSAKLTKHQAASVKPRGTSIKLQAASVKLQDS